MGYTYPAARKDAVIDDYHGTPVPDPYRWLEDPDAADTQAFIAAQNTLTRDFLDNNPARETLRQRFSQLWDYPRYSTPVRVGDLYFFQKNDGLQNQAILYKQRGLDGTPEVLLDPNTYRDDGTVALIQQSYTHDARLMAYTISDGGSDVQTIRVRNVETGHDLDDVIEHCRFPGIAWLPDGSGFYYNRYPDPATVPPEERQINNRLYFHTLGTPQADDELIYARPDAPELNFPPYITEDERYLVLHVWHGAISRNRIYYRPLDSNGDFIRLIDTADADYECLGSSESRLFFRTDLDAPRGRIIAIDLDQPEREHWQTIVAQGDNVLDTAHIVNGQFVVTYMQDAANAIKVYNFDGAFDRDIPLPALGSVVGVTGKPDHQEMFFHFTSFLYPSTIFHFNFTNGETATFASPELDFPLADFETQQVFCTSKDGTQVPVFLTHKKGLARSGENRVLLYGYGGFSINLTPMFIVHMLAWIEQGGIFAFANLRGGNEYGDAWHQAGMLERKQNVFDDFIAAAEWLIAEGFTRSGKLAIMGGSNGGLLVSACMTQRPDLYGAVICQVPVADMLRYHRFTAGRYWVPEYGNAEENPAHFQFLYAYSPLHNVREGETYPPTLILTAEGDDRVVPMHALKLAAALQAADIGTHPLLLRVETRAGHGLGKPTGKLIDQYADIYAFLDAVLG